MGDGSFDKLEREKMSCDRSRSKVTSGVGASLSLQLRVEEPGEVACGSHLSSPAGTCVVAVTMWYLKILRHAGYIARNNHNSPVLFSTTMTCSLAKAQGEN